MRLKLATTSFLIFSLLAMLSWPWTVGVRPEDEAGRAALREYATRSMIYFIVVIVGLFVTLALALLVIRQARLSFRDQTLENLKHLVEGTLQDHAEKREP